MNEYEKFQRRKQEAIQKKWDNAPKCPDCGEKKSYSPGVYGAYRCYPCFEKEPSYYHGTECYCEQCMGE